MNTHPEQIASLARSMNRIFSGEKLTYTDKEVELVMLGWQSELTQLQEQNTMLDAKLAKVEAVLKQALSVLENVAVWETEGDDKQPATDAVAAIKGVLEP